MKRSQRMAARRRFARRWLWIAAAALIALLVLADRSGLLLHRQVDDMARYHGSELRVSRIVSGHTIELQQSDPMNRSPVTQVRLLGLTAPLPASRGREAEPLADEAIELTRQLVHDRLVTLRLEPARTRDTFGRLLAHVEIPQGGTLNEALLEAGLARVDERSPHAMLVRYAQAEQTARRRSRGIWNDEG